MTMILKLDKDPDKIKIKCSNNWRYGLNRSTKNKLKVRLVKNPNIKKIYETYTEMEKNKSLPQTYSLKQFNEIFDILSQKIIYFECYNLNPQKLESLLHKFFGESCLSLDVYDNDGRRHNPREWFIAPLDIIEKAVELIINGRIIDYKYDRDTQSIINK